MKNAVAICKRAFSEFANSDLAAMGCERERELQKNQRQKKKLIENHRSIFKWNMVKSKRCAQIVEIA